MTLDAIKPVFGVNDKARLKPVSTDRLARNFKKNACSKIKYDTFREGNNKGADQSAGMRRLVCAFVDHKPLRQVFLRRGS